MSNQPGICGWSAGYPTDLANATAADVLLAWDCMGYPRRALRLRECAQAITERFSGEVPRQREELLSLPGIGWYTADAILAFAYEDYSVVLDTNIRRVLARWNGQALPAPTQTQAERQLAQEYVPTEPDQAWRWNAAIMEFGALVCTARNPRCQVCPVSDSCGWKTLATPVMPMLRIGRRKNGRGRTGRRAERLWLWCAPIHMSRLLKTCSAS